MILEPFINLYDMDQELRHIIAPDSCILGKTGSNVLDGISRGSKPCIPILIEELYEFSILKPLFPVESEAHLFDLKRHQNRSTDHPY